MKRVVAVNCWVASALFLAISQSAWAGWVKSGPIGAADLQSVIWSGNPRTTAYAAGWGKLFRSLDAGETWRAFALPSGAAEQLVDSLAVDAVKSSIVYAAINNGQVYRSDDAGANFVSVTSGLPALQGPLVLAADPVAEGSVYLLGVSANYVGALFHSTDRGAHWHALTSPGNVLSLAVGAGQPGIVYAGLSSGRIGISVDQGQHWSISLAGRSDAQDVLTLAASPVQRGVIAAGLDRNSTEPVAGQPVIARSTNLGARWASASNGLSKVLVPYALRQSLGKPDDLFLWAGDAQGPVIYRSTTSGERWIRGATLAPSTSPVQFSVSGDSSATILFATGGGLFRSTTQGAGWAQVTQGLSGADVTALAYDPHSPAHLWAGTAGGVFASIDEGARWTPRLIGNSGLSSITAIALDAGAPQSVVYAGTAAGLALTTDAGAHWSALPITQSTYVTALATDPVTPGRAYVAFGGTVFARTDNLGKTWVSQKHTDVIGLLPQSSGAILEQDSVGILRSVDAGDHWTRVINKTTITALSRGALSADTYVTAGVSSTKGLAMVLRSTDAGVHWSALPTPFGTAAKPNLIQSLTSIPGTRLLVGSISLHQQSLLVYSVDDGTSWHRLSTIGLPGSNWQITGTPAGLWAYPRGADAWLLPVAAMPKG